MIRRPPRSTLFPTRRSSDLCSAVSTRRCATPSVAPVAIRMNQKMATAAAIPRAASTAARSEEHTSELQSLRHLVCRLLLEKKKKKKKKKHTTTKTTQDKHKA